jgi:hypothetical protein
MKETRRKKRKAQEAMFPIAYWSHSSLVAYLRNPLAWYKRYVKKIYDTPKTPAAIIGTAGHLALEHFYQDVPKEESVQAGLAYVRSIPDFEINFGTRTTRAEKKKKRESMEREYLQAIGFYLARPPRHKVLGIEVRGMAKVPGVPIPVKAISDLVVESKGNPGALDIVDHKFVDSWSANPSHKPLFLLQAVFNYYTVSHLYGKPVERFIVIECKKKRNSDGRPQLRKYTFAFQDIPEAFELFHRLLKDASEEIAVRRTYLPNPSDMFEGEDSVEMYRLRLIEE